MSTPAARTNGTPMTRPRHRAVAPPGHDQHRSRRVELPIEHFIFRLLIALVGRRTPTDLFIEQPTHPVPRVLATEWLPCCAAGPGRWWLRSGPRSRGLMLWPPRTVRRERRTAARFVRVDRGVGRADSPGPSDRVGQLDQFLMVTGMFSRTPPREVKMSIRVVPAGRVMPSARNTKVPSVTGSTVMVPSGVGRWVLATPSVA